MNSSKLKGLTIAAFLFFETWSLAQAQIFPKPERIGVFEAALADISKLDMRRKVVEQRGLIEQLTDEVESLKEVISGHADVYGDLEEFATGDTNIFAESYETCGDVLVGQSGSITFTSDALKNTRHPTSCTWTIRANNRKTIKVALQPSNSSTSSSILEAFVVELLWKSDSKNDSIFTNGELKTKITKY